MKRFLKFLVLLALSPIFLVAQVDETKPLRVSAAVAYAKSAPLAELAAVLSPDKSESLTITVSKNKLGYEKWPNIDSAGYPDNVQIKMGNKQSKGTIVGFEGQGGTGSFPPDTDGDVNEDYFVQVVNKTYSVYDKTGTLLLGPLNLSTLWNDLPGPWVGVDNGDPIVVYDEEAERWVITQFCVTTPTKYELFAVSETSDPLGSYHLYAFSFGSDMNDYPKIGVWRDAYYATYNMFAGLGGYFFGGRITAVERDKMLVGDPGAAMVEFHKEDNYAYMPADIDGENLPEEGAPCPIMYINTDQEVEMWNFYADWSNPNNSSLTLGATIDVSSFAPTPNTYAGGMGGFITQPNSTQELDGQGMMIMNRLAFRKFANHESMVVTHSVVTNEGSSVWRGGIRWYEFRKTTSNWELYQEGTYAPDDNHRWMGSAAINGNGDIAIGYSISNSVDIYPSIRYTGRLDGDPLGEMTIEEIELKTGTSSQEHWRWGDYSCLNVDPSDDNTFWYTTEYNGWETWIAAFELGESTATTCNAGEDGYTCQNEPFITQGTGTNVDQIEWSTDGDGSFSPTNNEFNSTYISGIQDIENGGCTLTISVTGIGGGNVSDDMYLNIVDSPTCNAGDDAVISEDQSYTMQGTATHASEITWTTDGDGTFSDITILNAIYTYGPNDFANGGVNLNLHAEPISPCEGTDDDEMHLGIITGVVDLDDNSPGLSLFPNPTNDVFTMNIDRLNTGEQFTFFVYTSYGKEIYRQIVKAKSNAYERVIDLSKFVPGIYFVTVQSEQGTTTLKLIKK